MFIGLLIIFLVAIAAACGINKKRNARIDLLISRLPQGPRPLPIVGNALELVGGLDRTLNTMQTKWPAKYGEIFVSYVGSHRLVNISSPELVEAVFNSPKLLDKGADYDLLSPWLGEGLLLSKGEKWKARRRLLTPAFHYQILDNFIDVFNKQARILCRVLQDKCSGSPSRMLDIYPFLANCALDIVCEAAMGVEVNAQIADSDYVTAVHRISKILVERAANPLLAIDSIFAMTPTSREHDRLLKTMHDFTEKVIGNRRKEFMAKNADAETGRQNRATDGLKIYRPLLDSLLTSKDAASLTDRDIRDEIDTFMVAGHDTTTSVIAWFLYCMAENPEHQEKVFNELQDVFGEDMERSVTQQDLSLLTYLDLCIKESGRLYAPVPIMERIAKEDVLVGDYAIPEGTSILVLMLALHRNPRLYPDPLVYNPERFLPDQCEGRHPCAYIPFCAGPRNCIGQRFGMMEVKVALATLLRRFKVSISPECKKPILSWEIVLKPLVGMELLLTPRS